MTTGVFCTATRGCSWLGWHGLACSQRLSACHLCQPGCPDGWPRLLQANTLPLKALPRTRGGCCGMTWLVVGLIE